MADFVLRCNESNGELEYNEWTYDENDGQMKRKELPYIDGIGGNYDWDTNGSFYVYLKIELENQKVTFSMAPETGGAPGTYMYTVITTSTKAVGYSNYALFPSVGIGEENKYVNIHSFNAVLGYDSTEVAEMDNYKDTALAGETSDDAATKTATDYAGMVQKGVSISDATAVAVNTILIVGDGSSDYGVTGTAMGELGYEGAAPPTPRPTRLAARPCPI